MFKKTLVALSLTALAGQGMAATITSAGSTVSPQAVSTSVNVSSATHVMTTAAIIASGSVLNVSYSAAPSNPAAITTVLSGTCANDSLSYSGATNGGKTLNYTLIDAAAANIPVGCVVTTGTSAGTAVLPAFAKADVNTTGVIVTSSFTVVGAGVDPTPAAGANILKLGTAQYTLTATTPANAVVDVSATPSKTKFTTATGVTDTIVLTHGDLATGATVGAAKIVVTGDFSWADDPAVAGYQLATGAIAVAGGGAAVGTGVDAPTATTYTFTDATPANADAYTITFTPPTGTAAVVLPIGTFSATNTIGFTDLASSTGSLAITKAAGAFTLNGATVKIFSVPFGSEVESHSIFVSNSGTTTGAITGSMVWNGNAAVEFPLGNIQAGANKYLNVIDALTAAGEKPAFGRADITFTVNAPAADITMTAAYNTAEGRANLFMQEQANIASISSTAATSAVANATALTTVDANVDQALLDIDITCDNIASVDGALQMTETHTAVVSGVVVGTGLRRDYRNAADVAVSGTTITAIQGC